jgi:hypothetical protein
MKIPGEQKTAAALALLGLLLLCVFLLERTLHPQVCCDGPCWNPSEDAR